MSNTRTPSTRPTTARKVTRKTEERRRSALESGLRVKVDGEDFEVRFGDVTSALSAELRRHIGVGPLQLIASVANSPEPDLIGAFLWLARRCRGEDVEFGAVSITLAQIFSDDFEVDEPNNEVADPEA